MKLFTLLASMAAFCLGAHAQMDSLGNSSVDFNVDADTRIGTQKISILNPDSTFHHDDWFFNSPYAGRGRGVIDTTGASALRAQLVTGQNISFVKRMALPAYSVLPFYKKDGTGPIGARFWVDGVYFRDQVGTDATSYSGSKNGDNPNDWTGVTSPVGDKVDLVDVYTHVRTSGTNPVADSVWFFAGVSTVGVNGSRYFDIEVYRETITFDQTTNKFNSTGTSGGHSEWVFDATGKVIQTGDIIISVAYAPGRAPEIDFRIWVSNTSYSTITPQAFKFGSKFNSNGTAGYAQIIANSGSTNWGSGVANYTSNSSTTDGTYSTPWGTVNTTKAWSENYDQLQFVEVSLNFSRFGMNPFSYVTSFCKSPYASIIIKSRTSTEFNSSLADFVGPVQFTVKDLIPFTSKTDTVTCTDPTGIIQLSAPARNYYRWYNATGDTLRKDSDVMSFTVPKSGTYVVEATNFQGCPAMRRDTIVVAVDSIPPVAKALLGWQNGMYYLNGGDADESNQMTAFGRSKGLTWDWTGPDGFSANVEDPDVDPSQAGTYYLSLTEQRNGCRARDSIFLSATSFTLPQLNVSLSARSVSQTNVLEWSPADRTLTRTYHVERSEDGVNYARLYSLNNINGKAGYAFTDQHPQPGHNYYRIVSQFQTGRPQYSNTVSVTRTGTIPSVNVYRNSAKNQVNIAFRKVAEKPVQIKIMDLNGSLIYQESLTVAQVKTANSNANPVVLGLPEAARNTAVIIAVYQEGKVVATQKR